MSRTIARTMLLSFLGWVVPAFLAPSNAQELDYEFIAPTSGSISYNGLPNGTVQGSGIDVDLIIGLGTPLNNNVGRACVSCTFSFTSGPFLGSSSSAWTFAAGGTVAVTGGVDLDNNGVIGAGDIPLGTTLFSGTFETPVTVVVLPGGFRVVGGSFSDTQTSALAAFYGLPNGAAVYHGGLNLSFASSVSPPNAFSTTQLFSGNMANSAPVATPTPTDTPTNTPTNTATNTPTSTATDTATQTPTLTATATNTATPTSTMSSTPQPTNTPTATSTSTNTPTDTPSNTPTNTSVPTSTPSNTPTDTAVATNTPTGTPTNTSVSSSTPTNTTVPSSTPTNTTVATNTPTGTPTNTSVSSSTPTNTTAPSNTPTSTPTMTRTREIVEETATPLVAVDLAIEKHFADASCGRGEAGRYVVIVRNLGQQSTPAAPAVTDALPAGVTLTSAMGTGWDCSGSTATVVQCVATSVFAPGESRTIDIKVNIALTASPALVNTASVAAQPGELDLDNNTTTIVTLCVGGPTGAPAMGPIGFPIAIALLGAVAYWRLRGAFDE